MNCSTFPRRRSRFAWLWTSCLLLAGSLAFAVPAAAQNASAWSPTRTVKLIVAFPGGSSVDIVARLLAEQLRDLWSQPVVVENRVGADAIIGTDAAAKADPDGHTLYLATLGALALNPHLFEKLPYDPVRDFVGISYVAENPFVLAVSPESEIRSVADLVAISKKNAGKFDYGAAGSFGQMVGEALKRRTGADLSIVPYRGAPQALTDLLGGRVPLVIGDLLSVLPLHKDRKVRVIAVTSGARSPALPDVPTMLEAGVEGFEYATWYALMAPQATPKEVVAKLNSDVVRALDRPQLRDRFLELGLTARSSTPEFMSQLVRSEIAKWGPIAQEAGLKRK